MSVVVLQKYRSARDAPGPHTTRISTASVPTWELAAREVLRRMSLCGPGDTTHFLHGSVEASQGHLNPMLQVTSHHRHQAPARPPPQEDIDLNQSLSIY